MSSIDDFPKIDAHIHFNAGRKQILLLAKKYRFDLLSINTEVPDFPSIQKQQNIALTHQKHPTELHYATTIDTGNVFQDGWAEQTISKIKTDLAHGACGVKFWKNIGMSLQRPNGDFLMLDDPELRPVFDFLEQEQIPVLGHQGEPKNCWLPVEKMTVKSDHDYFSSHPQYHMYLHEECPDYWRHIEARDSVLSRHPDLNFVGLHLASLEWSLDEIGQRLDRFPNLAVDLAERISHLYYHAANNHNRVVRFFKKYQDRIIYGTDIIDDPGSEVSEITDDLMDRWTKHWAFFATGNALSSPQIDQSFRGLNLPEQILKKIYRENAIKWYNLLS